MLQIAQEYVSTQKKVLIGYTGFIITFYIVNYLLFSNAIDVPADLVFSIAFIIVIPGIVTLITLYFSDIEQTPFNTEYFIKLLIHSITPLIISMLCSTIYFLPQDSQGYWENLILLHGLSFPLIFMAIIMVHEIKLRLPKLITRLAILVGIVLSYFIIINIVDTYETRYLVYPINALYLYLLPLLFITLWYRKKVVDNIV